MDEKPDDVCKTCGKERRNHGKCVMDIGYLTCFETPVHSKRDNFTPKKGGGHPAFLALLDKMRELHCRKAADYGRGVDPFANVRASAEFGIPAWVGVCVRMGDKMHRIKSFIANGSLKNESCEDSLMDLAAYSLIALVLKQEEDAKNAA